MIKFLIFSLLTTSAAFSDTIYTYEEGNLLEKVFESLSSLLYGESKNSFNALLRISLTVGAFCALLLAFFRQKFEPLIRNFLLPGFFIVGFLLVPQTQVKVNDGKSINVPFFLGKFASWTSFSFHHLHGLFKQTIDTHPWVSNIHSNQNFFQHRKLSDPDLEENLRSFCRECVFRDLGLGLYTKQELAEAPDLIDFLSNRTSTQRAVTFDEKPIACKEAMEAMKEKIASELLAVAPPPLTEQPLDGQKILIDLLQEEIFRPDLKSPKTASWGAQGAIVLISLRSFFEALLYLLFPLMILISLLSFGIRIALLWVRAILWISTWPIFYLAVDLFLNAIWNFRAKGLALNLENAVPLSHSYTSMEYLAFASLSTIPFISWYLIKGGVAQFIHISSHLETKEVKSQADAPSHSPIDKDLSHDSPRQANWEVLVAPKPNDSFKNVENSRIEEHMDTFHRSLSSIQESVKDSGEGISKTVKETACKIHAPAPQSTAPLIEAGEDWSGSRMHVPSHGSWSEQQNPKTPT